MFLLGINLSLAFFISSFWFGARSCLTLVQQRADILNPLIKRPCAGGIRPINIQISTQKQQLVSFPHQNNEVQNEKGNAGISHRGQLNKDDIMHELGVIMLQIVNNH